jgi:catechol 2,3-dioxygenase-like lactoylglutathione lyase family enzyme
MIQSLDFIGIPSQDPARSRAFYVDTLAHLALHVDDVAAAGAELEAKGVEFTGDILDTGVCHKAIFTDPDGNDLMLHHRYARYDD